MATELVTLGFILRPHGVRGELKVRFASEDRQEIAKDILIGVSVSGKEPWFTRVEWVRPCHRERLVKLVDIDTRDQAEQLTGGELVIHPENLEKLPQGEYYHFELLGMRVVDEDGNYLGTLEEVFPTGSNDVYVIRSEGKEILLPAIDEVIRQVDPQKKTMVVHLLEGLV